MTTPGEAPAVTEFIASLADAVKKLSLLYAGTPDDRARPHLEDYLSSIEHGIIEAVGAGKATLISNGFRGAVMGRKHEIEGGGVSRA